MALLTRILHLLYALTSAILAAQAQDSTPFTYTRLAKNDSVLVIVDLQVGLAAAVRDYEATLFRNNIIGHAELGKLYNLPVILTTSVEDGPNGPLPKEVLEMYPDTPIVRRIGEVDAWDSPDFRAAVEATGRRQLIVAGITTDLCVSFLALSLREAGYHVVVNAEASGTFDPRVAQDAKDRMRQAGVQVMNLFSINGELFRDWRSTNPSAAETVPFINRYVASESWVLRSHAAAVMNGSLAPGQLDTITVGNNDTTC